MQKGKAGKNTFLKTYEESSGSPDTVAPETVKENRKEPGKR